MQSKKPHNPKSPSSKRRPVQVTKEKRAKQLYKILYKKPMSRRMAVTYLGYPDLTYLVTQNVNDWIKSGKAQVVGTIRCTRSKRFVEAVTTNPEYFKSNNDNQLKIFE